MRFADRPKKDPTFLQWQRDVVALGSVNMAITGSGSALLWSVEKMPLPKISLLREISLSPTGKLWVLFELALGTRLKNFP